MELELVTADGIDRLEGRDQPAAVVIDLHGRQDLSAVRASKAMWPQAMVIGLVTLPGTETWSQAEEAGCDLVTTRGAVVKAARRLAKWLESPGGRRRRLFSLADQAGRLGLVERFDDPVSGPLAVYQLRGATCVAADACPHAGARLSLGEVDVDAGIVTCPEHGSRFEVCSGDRVRGPADEGIATYPVMVAEGQVYVQLDAE